MAILETTLSRSQDGMSIGLGPYSMGKSRTKQLSLLTLTFQSSILILIMHYSRIMPTAGDHRYFTSTAVFLTEVIKLSISLTLAIYETSKTLAPSTPATVLFEQIYRGVFTGDGWKLAVPAALYTLQNLLQYVAIENMDAVHFQVLYQLKILITAVFSVCLLGRTLTSRRWLALIILTLGVSIVSLPSSSPTSPDLSRPHLFWNDMTDHFFPRSLHELGQAFVPSDGPGAHLSKRSATYEGIDADLPPSDPSINYSLGVTCVLVAAALSGLTGVYFEKLLKQSLTQTSVWTRNVQLSLYSLIIGLVGGVFYQDGQGIREHGFFEGYNWVVWTAIGLQALGGLVGSLVIRDSDNIVKNFATSFSILISLLVSVFLFDFRVTKTFLLGMVCVLLSTYLYSLPASRSARPPPIRIASFEKPHIISALTPRGSPGYADEKRLNRDPFQESSATSLLSPALASQKSGAHGPERGRNLAPGDLQMGTSSSRPSSPMLHRASSRTNLASKRDE